MTKNETGTLAETPEPFCHVHKVKLEVVGYREIAVRIDGVWTFQNEPIIDCMKCLSLEPEE